MDTAREEEEEEEEASASYEEEEEASQLMDSQVCCLEAGQLCPTPVLGVLPAIRMGGRLMLATRPHQRPTPLVAATARTMLLPAGV